jgi:hypothetical protein
MRAVKSLKKILVSSNAPKAAAKLATPPAKRN